MTRGDADRGAEMPGAASLGSGRNPREGEVGASRVTARLENSKPETKRLMEAVVERENMVQALKRVEANKGAPGMDGMPVTELWGYLRAHWPSIKEALLEGWYEPSPVRRVEIPKPERERDAATGYPDGSGPSHTAGVASGDDPSL